MEYPSISKQSSLCLNKLNNDILSHILTMLPLRDLCQICYVSRKFSQLGQIEIFVCHNNLNWRWEPVNPQVGEIFDYLFNTHWYTCSVVSWDEKTMQMGVHYVSYDDSYNFVADLFNPLIMSKFRPHDNTSLYSNSVANSPRLKFQTRQRPFRVLKMINPQPNQIFQWYWGNKYYESRVIFTNGSRIMFRYLRYSDWLTISDIDLNLGSMVPLSGEALEKNPLEEADSLAEFQEVTYNAHEIAKIMFECHKATERFKKRLASHQNDSPNNHNSRIPLLKRSDFESAKEGQVFLLAKRDNLMYGQLSMSSFSVAILQKVELKYDKNEKEKLFLSYKLYDESYVGREFVSVLWGEDIKYRCHPFIDAYFYRGEMMLFPSNEVIIGYSKKSKK